MFKNIRVLAGENAFKQIKETGFKFSKVKMIAGASGAAKFLVLTGLDRYLLNRLANRTEKLHLIGSSIGAFRMVAYAQKNPIEAINILEDEYIKQSYSQKPSKEDVTNFSKKLINDFVKDEDIEFILNNKKREISLLASKSKILTKTDFYPLLLANLGLAWTLNSLSRKALSLFFKRTRFTSNIETQIDFGDIFETKTHRLSIANFKKALLASGSIPLLVDAVKDIKNIKGVFRDGGLVDYHLDFPFLPKNEDGIVLYPHFYPYIIPGWFDKASTRRGKNKTLSKVLIICPSEYFVNSLPDKKIPDRYDFKTMSNQERIKKWRYVTRENKRLADEFHELIETNKIRDFVTRI